MSRSRLVFVLACFLGVPAGAAFAQNVSFHRFVDELYPTGPPTEQKIKLGREFRNVLDSLAPTRSPLKGVTVDADNTVLLGEVFEGFEMSRDAAGVVIAMDSRIGRLHYVFPKSTVDALAGLADERARALPHQYPAVSGQIVQRVSVAVAEARALPQEFTSRLVVVPADARLHFSVGFDDLLAGLPPRVPTRIKARQSDGSIAETILHDGRPTAPVRFRIVVEIADSITTVFDEEHRPAPNAINEHWRERTVDLSGFAGKRARFRFIREEVSVSNTSQGAYSFPLWGSPILTGRKIPADERKPNVILISLDTLRADHLGCYGYARATSPNIDAFAKDANLFERCLSNSSWTTPAHASMFTGLPPTTHRAGAQGMSWRLRGGLTTLPELFRERGYLTAAFTEGIALNGSLGFFQGFEQYSNGEPLGEDPAAGSAGKTFDRAKRWLDDFGASPFFLFLHTYEIHAPYGAPAGHRGRFSKRYSERVTPDKGIGSKAERDRVVALYDEGIAYTDHVFGELMVYLKERDLYENSIIVVFSDHGEEFWEHGDVAHGRTLYQEVLHVPLLIKESGHPAGGARISTRVSLSDAFATLNEMAAIEQIAPPESSSLVPLMRGDASKYTRSLVRSELFQNDRRHFYVSAVRGSWKYIIRARFEDLDAFRIDGGSSPSARWSGARELDFLQSRAEEIAAPAGGPDSAASARVREWLFDLRADPGETRSLARSSVDELQILRSEIVKAMQASTEFARTRLAPGARAEPLSEAERANLEALGYL